MLASRYPLLTVEGYSPTTTVRNVGRPPSQHIMIVGFTQSRSGPVASDDLSTSPGHQTVDAS